MLFGDFFARNVNYKVNFAVAILIVFSKKGIEKATLLMQSYFEIKKQSNGKGRKKKS
jgi:hypothetical protein